jgi:chromosome segregation ATPase
MSNEFKDKMLQLLTAVDDVKASEAALQSEKARHQEQIAKSEVDLKRTEADIAQCRETELRLKRELTDLRDAIFARPENEETIVEDAAHVVTDGSAPSVESDRQRAWKDRQRALKTVS